MCVSFNLCGIPLLGNSSVMEPLVCEHSIEYKRSDMSKFINILAVMLLIILIIFMLEQIMVMMTMIILMTFLSY